MSMVNIKFDYRKLRRTLIRFIVFIMLLQVFVVLFVCYVETLLNKKLKIVTIIFIFLSSFTMTMFLSQIILLIVSIKQRFEALNFLLKSHRQFDLNLLKTASRIHQALTDIIDAMNQSYCRFAMFVFASTFGFFNLFLFGFKIVLEVFNIWCLIHFTAKALLSAYSFLFTMCIIVVSNRATNEARKTVRILYELLHKVEEDFKWNDEFLSFVQQIQCSSVRFSCGFFTYDYQLLFKVSCRKGLMCFYVFC